jgi:TP901 family phage tail tape measure protein
MSGVDAAATLSLQIDTKSAQENIDKLNAAYNELHANMSKKVGADLGGEINKSVKSLQGSLATVAALINSTNNALDDIVAAGSRSFAKISTEAKNAAQAVVTLSEAMRANTAAAQASSNAATVKLLKERAEAATLAAEAEKRLAQVTAANISSAQASSNAATVKLLKERAEAATLAAEAEKRLAQVTAANISSAQASSNAATVKLLKERAEAATLAAEAEKRLAQVAAANISSAQASSNAATVKLLKERAEAATLAAEAEKRLAQVTAANISSAQASSNAATVKLLKERAEAATLAAEAEKRLAQVTAANISSAQASSNAATVKLLKERAEAATLAAEAEKRLAQVAAANISSAQASSNAATQRLIQQRTSGTATPRYNPLMNTVDTAVSATQSASAIKELDSAHKSLIVTQGSLGKATRQSAEHQMHWNTIANEAHAAARGLAGAVGNLWLTYGSLVPLLAGAALAGGFKAATTAGAEFAYQLTFVKALGGETADTISQIGAATLTMSKDSLHSPVEMANGLRILSQAGLEAKDAMLALPTALDLATVGEMTMSQASITLAGVMNAFKLQVTDMGHIGDVFAKAAALSQTSVVGITEAMRSASVVGEQYGTSMEDSATAVTLLAKVNIFGTAAGTAYRNMLKELYTPGRQAADVMKMLGVSASDAQGNLRPFADVIYDLKDKLGAFDKISQTNILQKIFGERGAKEAIAMLSQTREEWDKLKDSIQNSDSFITNVAAQLEMSTKGRFKQAVNTMQANMISAFDQSSGSVRDLADSLKRLADSKEFKTAVDGIVTSVAQLANVLVTVAPLLINVAEGFVAWKGLSLLVGTVSATAVAFTGLGTALTIVAAESALAGGGLAGLRIGLLATSSAAGVAAGATGLGGIATGAAALFGPAGWITAGIVALGAFAYALYDVAKGESEVTNKATDFVSALDREVKKIEEEVKVLKERNRLKAEGRDVENPEINLAQREQEALKSKLAELNATIARKTAAGRDISNPDGLGWWEAKKLTAQKERLEASIAKADSLIAAGLKAQSEKVSVGFQAFLLNIDEQASKLERGLGKAGAKAITGELRAALDAFGPAVKYITDPKVSRGIQEHMNTLLESARAKSIGTGDQKFTGVDSRGANALFKAQTEEIVRGYADRTKAVNEEFNQYKKILDQRVKYGALAQGAENALLEQAQQNTDLKTAALLAAEKQELSTLLASKETTEAEKISMRTRIDAITAMQREGEVRRAGILALNTEKEALQQLSAARKLDNEIASFVEKEQLFRSKEITKEIMKKEFNPEDIVGAEAYYATLERGQEKLKEYAKAVNDAEKAQADFAAQVKNGSIAGSQQSAVVQKLTSTSTSNLDKYDAIFSQAAVQYNVNEALLKAVAYVESRGNANAVSNQGAQGLMQLMPATARSLGVTNSFDPQQNIFGGAKLLRENLNATGGDEIKALLMYHGGPNQKTWGEKTQSYPGLVNSAMTRFTGGSLSVAANDSVMSTEAVTQAMEANAKAVEDAKKAYEDFWAEVLRQAEANKSLMMSLKGPEEAVKRMKQEFSASAEMADATLRARKASGEYTDLEAALAEGDINRKKLEQLAEMKTAYEALGKAGEASAKQIQAQMIELSAHLDPVADKIRGIFENSLEGFFNDVTKGTKSVKEAFADLARGILKSFSEIIAKTASQEVMKLLDSKSSSGGLFGSISGIIRKLFNNDSGGGFSAADFANLAASHIDFAKGGVFSGSPSLHAYANTIQTTPKYFGTGTVHKFAKGGVFAEAGPEAVMPLTRDKSGRLGVMAQNPAQSNVINITVNGANNAPDVRRSIGQASRELINVLGASKRYN